MRNLISRLLVAAILCLAWTGGAFAQAYPTNNPVYIPTAVLAATNLTTTGDVYFAANGTGAISVRLSGTHGSVVAAIQGSNDVLSVANGSATWTTLSAQPVGGGAVVTSLTGNGFWLVNGAGMTRLRVHVTTMASGTLTTNIAGTSAPVLNSSLDAKVDPCQDPNVAKSSAVINVGAATTTEIVALTAAQSVKVCSYNFTLAGTTPSFTFKTGTGADCVTGTASLTGVMLPTSGSIFAMGGSGTLLTSAAASAICGTTVGTGSSAQGFLTYVKN